MVDVALYEAVFNCMESLLPEYSAFGAVRQPRQAAPCPASHPSNAYRCACGSWALIAGNGDSIFQTVDGGHWPRRLWAKTRLLSANAGRVARVAEIDDRGLAIGLPSTRWRRY